MIERGEDMSRNLNDIQLLTDRNLQLIQRKKAEGKLVIEFTMTRRCINFSRELEETFFPPGTPRNADFELVIAPSKFFVIIPNTEEIRKAIFKLAAKHRFSSPDWSGFLK